MSLSHRDLSAMPASTHFDNLVQYTSLAAATIKEIAEEAQIPFLLSASSLVLEILHAIQVCYREFKEKLY